MIFRFHFRSFSRPDLHTTYRRYPVNFLTPAVFAFFRPLQFWVLTTQPLFLPFLFFPVSPHSGFPGACLLSFDFLPFPFCFTRFPVFPFRFSVLGFSVSFLSSFLVFAPTAATYKCSLLFRSPFGSLLFCVFPFRFLSIPSGSDYLAFRFFFSLSLFPLTVVFSGSFSPFFSVFRLLFPVLGTQLLLQFLSPAFCFASQRLLQRLCLLPFGFRLFPLSFRLRFRLLGWVIHPEN